MSYQVIARKYRPQRFADVVGQEHVTQTLSNAIQQNRIAHAYLFVGPRGTGKTTLARIFAKCLNCTGGPKVDFAEDDPRCQEIAEGRSLDVLEIDGASNRGIEEVRELRETVKYAPATSRFKIYIIDEVHMLTKEAFNALLKTLEEPPAHVKFMFATTEPEKVLPTILSRCQRFDLRRIPTPLIIEHLARIAKLENVQVDAAALHAIARGAEGGMRDAQSTLDQLISFCGTNIVEDDVLAMFGLAARSQILGLAQAILTGQSQVALRHVDELAKKGKDLGRLLSDLLGHFRNLLLFQVSQGDLGLVDVCESEAAFLAEQSSQTTTAALTRVMDLLSEYEGRLRDAASKRILIEIAVLKAVQARTAVNLDLVLEKLQKLRAEVDTPSNSAPGTLPRETPERIAAPVPTAAAPSPGARAPSVAETGASEEENAKPVSVPANVSGAARATAPVTAGAVTARPNLVELWGKILESVGRVSQFLRTYLLEAHPVSLTKTVFTVGFDPQFADHFGMTDNPKNRALLQTKLQELGYPDVQVRIIQAEAPADWTRPEVVQTVPVMEAPAASADPPSSAAVAPVNPPAMPAAKTKAAPMTKDDFKNDPLIRQALDLFKGQIVEVRA